MIINTDDKKLFIIRREIQSHHELYSSEIEVELTILLIDKNDENRIIKLYKNKEDEYTKYNLIEVNLELLEEGGIWVDTTHYGHAE